MFIEVEEIISSKALILQMGKLGLRGPMPQQVSGRAGPGAKTIGYQEGLSVYSRPTPEQPLLSPLTSHGLERGVVP